MVKDSVTFWTCVISTKVIFFFLERETQRDRERENKGILVGEKGREGKRKGKREKEREHSAQSPVWG